MEARRIQSVGKGSYSISLPKDWITHNHLKEKDFVFIDNLNNNLIINAENHKPDNKPLYVEYKKIKNLREFIRMCYIKGINNIKISFGSKEEKESSRIRDILERFHGYSITTEEDKLVEISLSFKDMDISLEKIMKRGVYLINLMFEQLEKRILKN